MRSRIGAIALGLALSCAAGSAWAQQATLLLVDGKVWTENPAQAEAQAVAIDGDHILAVGDSAALMKMAGPSTKVIDLKGRRVVPGFNDAHVHFIDGGASLAGVQLLDATSQAEFRARVAAYARTQPKGAWITQSVWDHQSWTPVALPTHQLIDDVTPDNPVLLWRLDGHMALANAVAMKLAGVDHTTQDPPGGEIVRDADGEPTGVFKDEATKLITKVQPQLTDAAREAAMVAALADAARHGVTSVQNVADSPEDPDGADNLRIFQRFERDGRLTVRIYDARGLYHAPELADIGVRAAFGSPRLRIGFLKDFADGAIGSTTAWMQAPFLSAPGKTGLPRPDLQHPQELYARLEAADRAGLQIAIHAIGDRAIHEILDMYARLEADDGPADRRLRIEHAQHIAPADLARFGQLHVIASMQPYHAIDDGRWVEGAIGHERAKTSYAWRSVLDGGAVLAFGSDWNVAPMDPVMGIYAAVTRRTLDGKHPDGWIPEQRITVAQAVHAYTVGSAYAEFQEKVKGSLEPGKLADLVVLSDDIFAIPPEKIADAKVDLTVFDGRVIYQRK